MIQKLEKLYSSFLYRDFIVITTNARPHPKIHNWTLRSSLHLTYGLSQILDKRSASLKYRRISTSYTDY